MVVRLKFHNGLVFGIAHQYYKDISKAEEMEGTVEEKMTAIEPDPMIMIYLGPFIVVILL